MVDNPFLALIPSRGLRNNNPGNIRATDTAWQGEVASTDPEFEQFASAEDGVRAMAKNLQGYQNKHGLNTIKDIVSRYAPPSENNTDAYIQRIAEETGFLPNEPLDLNDPTHLTPLMNAMIKHENGVPLDPSTVAAGVGQAVDNPFLALIPKGAVGDVAPVQEDNPFLALIPEESRGTLSNAAISFAKGAQPITPLAQGAAALQSSAQQTGFRINKDAAMRALDAFNMVDSGKLSAPSKEEIDLYSTPQSFSRGGLPQGVSEPLTNEGQDVLIYRQIAFDPSIPKEEKVGILRELRQKYADAVAAADIGVATLTPVRERELYKAGADIEKSIEEALPQTEEEKNRPTAKVGQALGSLTRYVTTSLLSGGTATTLMGVTESAGQQYQDAIASGASEQDAARAAGLGAPLGLIEKLPAEKILSFAKATKKPVEEAVEAAWKVYSKKVGEGAAFEGFQEWLQQTGSNIIAKDIVEYDKDRSRFEGSAESAGYGGGAGGFAAAVATAIGRRRGGGVPAPANEAAPVEQPADIGTPGNRPNQPAATSTLPEVNLPESPLPPGDYGGIVVAQSPGQQAEKQQQILAQIASLESLRDKFPENSPTRQKYSEQIDTLKQSMLPPLESVDVADPPVVKESQSLTESEVIPDGVQEKGNGRPQEIAPPVSEAAPITPSGVASPINHEAVLADLEKAHDALPEDSPARPILKQQMDATADKAIETLAQGKKKRAAKDVTAQQAAARAKKLGVPTAEQVVADTKTEALAQQAGSNAKKYPGLDLPDIATSSDQKLARVQRKLDAVFADNKNLTDEQFTVMENYARDLEAEVARRKGAVQADRPAPPAPPAEIPLTGRTRGKPRKAPERRLSLNEALAADGGIEDTGGDLTDQDLHTWHRRGAFRPKLIAPHNDAQGNMLGTVDRGKRTQDNRVVWAQERGYFPPGIEPSIENLKALMIQDDAGNRVYSQADQPTAKETAKAEDLAQEADRAYAENRYGAVPAGAFTDIMEYAKERGIETEGRSEYDVLRDLAADAAVRKYESERAMTDEADTQEEYILSAADEMDIPFDVEMIDAADAGNTRETKGQPEFTGATQAKDQRPQDTSREAKKPSQAGRGTAERTETPRPRSDSGAERGAVNTPPPTKSTTPERKAPVVNEPRVWDTSITDHYKGESFGVKNLTINDVVKAQAKVSVLRDEVAISYIETAGDSLRQGHAKRLVDDLFREFPNKRITITNTTEDGARFFEKNYNIIDGEQITQKSGGKSPITETATQSTIPGTAPISDKQLAERGMEGRKQAKVAQKPVASDGGLFSDESKQVDLFSPPPKKSDIIDENQSEQGDDARTSVSGIPEILSPQEVPAGGGERNTGRSSTRDRAASVGSAAGSSAAPDEGAPGGSQQPAGGSDDGSLGSTGDDVRRPDAGSVKPFQINPKKLGVGGLLQKFDANIEAIETLKKIESENRPASPLEKDVLARYVGWGGLVNAFPDQSGRYKDGYAKRGQRLAELLTKEEYKSARASTINAHYTAPQVISAMYDAMEQLGFKGGRILEPGSGIGNFMGMLPNKFRKKTRFTAVEMDSLSGRMSALIYPEHDVRNEDFSKTDLREEYYDAVIGNVPFASIRVPYLKKRYSLHDFFMRKSIDGLKPGGVMAIITSRYTMDKMEPSFRAEMHAMADLVGAIRLPGTAFKGNANTEVVTDILFFRKRKEGEPTGDTTWLSTSSRWINGETLNINDYFTKNPAMLVGELGISGTMYAKNDLSVTLPTGADIESEIAARVSLLPSNIWNPKATKDIEQMNEDSGAGPVPINLLPGGVFVGKDGETFFEKQNADIATPVIYRGKTLKTNSAAGKMLSDYILLRDATNLLMHHQANPQNTEDSLALLRKQLSHHYDRFVGRFGKINTKEVSYDKNGAERIRYPVLDVIGIDAEYPKVAALEHEKDGNLEKSAIFTRNTVTTIRDITKVGTARDGLAASLIEHGKPDIPYIAQLYGKEPQEIIEELGGLIYRNPASEEFETAEVYLSGNVRKKLEQARAAAEKDRDYLKNVQSLEQVIPTDLEPSEIGAILGSPWIPTNDIADFVESITDATNVQVGQIKKEALWSIGYGYVKNSIGNTVDFGTSRASAISLIEDALNMKQPTIYDKVDDKSVVNQQETFAAREKMERLKERFAEWIWEDTSRADRLARYYNDNFNNSVAYNPDGSHLTFPGMNPHIQLRPHQKNAVWRNLQGNNTLLHHSVGAGKTMVMIATAMEMRRIGLRNKPLIAVPNHMLEQFSREFIELYPNAKILIADKDQMSKENRLRFQARVANNSWDAVIMTHSSLERTQMSAAYQQDFINKEISEYADDLREAAASKNRNATKRIEAAIQKLEKRIEELSAADKKDNFLDFESLGVDQLIVDEAHAFKNLPFRTKMQNVKSLPRSTSQRAFDMLMRTTYLGEVNGEGKGVIFATATPISNSMAEAYTMMRYMRPDLLRERAIDSFDAWAAAFGQLVTKVETTTSGGLKQATRFSKFVNIPELMQIYRSFADIKLPHHLNLKVPKIKGGKIETILSPSTMHHETILQQLDERMAWIQKHPREMSVDNHLKVTNDGRKAAMDVRWYSDGMPDIPDSKINNMVNNIHDIWKETEKDRLTQLAFIDIGKINPTKREAWSVYGDVYSKLLRKGIPEAEVAIIHDYKTDVQKARLFSDVRSGKVRVLIGSTDKMGVGTNVQKKLYALHHLDPTWRPSDIEQRNGRIERQGNDNEEIRILRYTQERSFDTYMWQNLEIKAKYIRQILDGDASIREGSDVGDDSLSFAETKAITSGNPELIELAELDVTIQKLSAQKKSHSDTKIRLRAAIDKLPSRIAADKARLANIDSDIKNGNIPEKLSITLGKKVYDSRADANAVIKDRVQYAQANYDLIPEVRERPTEIGKYGKFTLLLFPREATNGIMVDLLVRGDGQYTVDISGDSIDYATRIENAVKKLPQIKKITEDEISTNEKTLSEAQKRIDDVFPAEDELKKAQMRRAEIVDKMLAQNSQVETAAASADTSSIRIAVEDMVDDNYNPDEEDGEDVKFSRSQEKPSGLTKADVTQAITKRFGKHAKKLIDASRVEIVQNVSELPYDVKKYRNIQGFYHADGNVYLVADNIKNMKEAENVFIHEAGVHAGMRNIMGEQFDELLETIRQKMKSASSKKPEDRTPLEIAVDAASERAYNARTPAADMVEETLAYMVDSAPDLPIVKRIVSAVKRWLHDQFGVFEMTPEDYRQIAIGAIRGWAKQQGGEGGGVYSKAGKLVTDNPNFRKWFGNSKVVDADGKPLVVYHGTKDDIHDFRISEFGKTDEGWFGRGFYFSQDPEQASIYAQAERGGGSRILPEGNVIPVYLSIQKPFETDLQSLSQSFVDSLIEDGYDGIIHWPDGIGRGIRSEIIVFSPTQIKSIHNRGTYDPNDARILYSRANDSAVEVKDGRFKHKLTQRVKKGQKDIINGWIRNLTKEGLAKEIFEDKLAMEGVKLGDDYQISYMAKDFERDVHAAYKKPYKKLSAAEQEEINKYLGGDTSANIPEALKPRIAAMRAYLDSVTSELQRTIVERIDLQMEKMTPEQRAQLVEYWDTDGESGSADAAIQSQIVLLQKLETNKGRYLTRAYRAFKEKDWMETALNDPEIMAAARAGIANRDIAQNVTKASGWRGAGDFSEAFTQYWKDGDKTALHKALDKRLLDNAMKEISEEQGDIYLYEGKRHKRPMAAITRANKRFDALVEAIEEKRGEIQDSLMSPNDVDAEIESILEDAQENGSFVSFVSRGGKLGSKDVTLLKKRKDLPEWYKLLLGEYKDPKVNFVQSATKMTTYIANHDFLMGVRKRGLGAFLFDEPKKIDGKSYVAKLAGDTSDTMSPLNGLYTTREFKQGMADAMEVFSSDGIWGTITSATSKVKAMKTVYNVGGQFRNFLSNGMLAVKNGHVTTKHLLHTFKTIKVDLTNENDPALRDYIKDARRRKVIGDGIVAESLRRTLKEAIDGRNIADSKFITIPQNLYRAGDDIWRINAWESETANLMKTGMSEGAARDLAAKRVHQLYPTYSMTPRLLDKLRQWPIFAAFPSWSWEQLRTTKNHLLVMKEDYDAGRHLMAAKRMAGLLVAAGLADALAYYMQAAAGALEDEIQEAVRDLSPFWMKNSSFIPLGRDVDGLMEYFDTSYLDPLDYMKRPIRALFNDNYDGFDEKLWASIKEASKPFLGLDIPTQALVSLIENKNNSVYDPNNPLPGVSNFIGKTVTTPSIPQFGDIIKSLQPDSEGNPQVSPYGKVYKLRDTVPAFFGFRRNTMNAPQSLTYASSGFARAKADATSSLSKVVGKFGTVTDDQMVTGYEALKRGREKAFKDIIRNVNSARVLGAPDERISRSLKASGVSNGDRISIMKGEIPTWHPDKQFLDRAKDRALAGASNDKQRKYIIDEHKRRTEFIRGLAKKDHEDFMKQEQPPLKPRAQLEKEALKLADNDPVFRNLLAKSASAKGSAGKAYRDIVAGLA